MRYRGVGGCWAGIFSIVLLTEMKDEYNDKNKII